jgi:hypothetical protein
MRIVATQLTGRVEDAQLQQLPRVVPLVDRVADVEPLVALQANQVGAKRGGRRRRQRCLANASLALQEQRTSEPDGQEQRDGQTRIDHVAFVAKPLAQIG